MRKAQITIEFGAGFILFMLTVAYIAFSTMNTLPVHYQNSREDNLRINAWILSSKILEDVTINEKLNVLALDSLSACDEYGETSQGKIEYDNLKSIFDLGETNDFHLNINEYPVALTETLQGLNYTGTLEIYGTVNFEVYNSSGSVYDAVLINGTSYQKGGVVDINGKEYVIRKINKNGQFVILDNILINCGKNPTGNTNTMVVKRYSTYDKRLAKVEVEFW